jgi:hypothetical protein
VNAARVEKNVVVLNGCRNIVREKNGVRSVCDVKLMQLHDELVEWLRNIPDSTEECRGRR